MAGRGRKVTFHGAFGSKAKAVAKERKVGGFIKRVKVRGDTRYVVMTERRGRK
jgi:hypothetical protein